MKLQCDTLVQITAMVLVSMKVELVTSQGLFLHGSCEMSVHPDLQKEVVDVSNTVVLSSGWMDFSLVLEVTVLGRFDCIWNLCEQMLHPYRANAKAPVREPACFVLC